MNSYRTDKDSLGDVQVPIDAYYGPFTVRASSQYKVTGERTHQNVIKAFVMIKKSAALANRNLKVLDKEKADAIVKASDEILGGALLDQFIVDAINSGAGTAINMNTNEVIANRALEILGHKKGEYDTLNPNDHVNMSQSSNDTFPTAMHIAILLNMREAKAALSGLVTSLKKKEDEFANVIKIGRTHLMDALPVTLGNEFSAYAFSIKMGIEKIDQSSLDLEYVALGGTAVGTGANTPPGYKELVIKYLAELSGLNLRPSKNTFYSLQSKFEVAMCSSVLRNIAIELTKIFD
jgi:aspartate ammonia-lyase